MLERNKILSFGIFCLPFSSPLDSLLRMKNIETMRNYENKRKKRKRENPKKSTTQKLFFNRKHTQKKNLFLLKIAVAGSARKSFVLLIVVLFFMMELFSWHFILPFCFLYSLFFHFSSEILKPFPLFPLLSKRLFFFFLFFSFFVQLEA